MNIIINLIAAIAAIIFGGDPAATTSTNCSGFVVTAADGQLDCNVVAGQRLDITGVGFDRCMDYGGIWLPDDKGTCQGVDR